jgi:hypothetical protein
MSFRSDIFNRGGKMKELKLVIVGRRWFSRTWLPTVLMLAVFAWASAPALAVDFDVKGTNVTLGGYLKLMMIYDIDGAIESAAAPFKGDLVGGYDPPLDGTTGWDTDDFRMHARESRLFVKTKSQTEQGVLETHFEGDFYGGSSNATPTWSNSEAFRLRHAYGSFTRGSHVLMGGQNWSTFMDLAAGVPDMDIAGDPGFTFVRQAQLRYQYNLRPGHYIAAAIENTDRGLTATGDGLFFINRGDSSEELPDFVLKYFYANKTLTFSPRLLVRQFDLTDTTTDESDTAIGWGAALSSSVKAGPVKFYATFMYGDGMGRYGGLGNIAGAGLTADNEVETVGFMSANGGMTLSLSDTVNWTVGAGWAENDDDAYEGADAVLTGNGTKTAIGYHTNVKWKVTPAFEWAVGVAKYEREVMDGREGDMIRTQMYFQYSF